jgi:hypothetical protein
MILEWITWRILQWVVWQAIVMSGRCQLGDDQWNDQAKPWKVEIKKQKQWNEWWQGYWTTSQGKQWHEQWVMVRIQRKRKHYYRRTCNGTTEANMQGYFGKLQQHGRIQYTMKLVVQRISGWIPLRNVN